MTALTLQMVDAAAALIRDTPKVGLYSCRLFPDKQTTSFKAEDGEVFHIAAPEFWVRMKATAPMDLTGSLRTTLYGIPLIDLDLDAAEKARVMDALQAALIDDGKRRADALFRPAPPWTCPPLT